MNSLEDINKFLPETFSIETVLNCNLKCTECALGCNMINRKKGFLSFEKFKIIADKIRPFVKYLYLHIWGEPMLNKDIIKMIKYASGFTRTNIHSNGNILTEEMAEELITSGVTDLSISVDGVTQEVYEKYRVKGDVNKAFRSLEILHRLNVRHGNKVNLSSQFIVFKHNQHEMEMFQKKCKEIGVNFTFKAPYIRSNSSLLESDLPQYRRVKSHDLASLRNAMTQCDGTKHGFTILLDGSVVICCYDHNGETVFGNIFKQDVMEIWNSKKYRDFRFKILTGSTPDFCLNNCLLYSLKAEASYRQDLSNISRQIDAKELNKHGEDLFLKGDIDGAINAFLKAITIDRDFILPYNNLGVLYWQTGDSSKALSYLSDALKIDRAHRNTLLNYCTILETLGEKEKAKKLYSVYLEKNSDDEMASICKTFTDNEINNKYTVKDEITPGKRIKKVYEINSLSEGLEKVKILFIQKNYFAIFDVFEQLLNVYEQNAIDILEQAYEYYKSLPYKDRFHLYQGRYFNFGIRPGDKVLDIGSGHNPFPFATHLADIAVYDNQYGRGGTPFKFLEGKPVYEINIEDMPFQDKEFDFIYCSHVLEHVGNPEKSCEELMRVGRKGYIETPTRGKDLFLNATKISNHLWAIDYFNDTLIFTEYTEEEIDGLKSNILLDMNCNPQTKREKAFSSLMCLKANLINTMILWNNRFNYEVRRLTCSKHPKELRNLFEKEEKSKNMPIKVEELSKPTVNEQSNRIKPLSLSENKYNEIISQECTEKKQLKFLQIHTFYELVIKEMYHNIEGLEKENFSKQMEKIVKYAFGAVHMFAPYFSDIGYQSQLIIANCPYSQQQWLKENNQTLSSEGNWIYEIAKRQIEAFKPDILYLGDPITFDSSFVRSLSWKPSLVIGWRAANIPETTDWSEFDIILSMLTSLRQAAFKLGAKSAEHFLPGFPEWIYTEIKEVKPIFDVVFSGQWTLGQHQKRNFYLGEIAKASTKRGKEFSCGFYLSGQVETIIPEVARYNLGGRFGIEMHKALRMGKIAFDARGDIGIRNMDLAGKETANMRIFEVTGSGVFLLTEYHENLKNFFELGKEIETFRNEKELIEKIHYYLEHEHEREEIARRGQRRCLQDYSMSKRVYEFDKVIQRYLLIKSGKDNLKPEESVNQTFVEKINASAELKAPGLIINKAIEQLNMNNNTEALQLFEKAIILKPDMPGINYGKALALTRLEQKDKAIDVLNRLLDMMPLHRKARLLYNELIGQSIVKLSKDLIPIILSPLTNKNNISLERQIMSEDLIKLYKQNFNIDITKYFLGIDHIRIYKCLDTDFKFYYPFNLEGDSNFYEILQKLPWYYMDWKWEHEICKHLIKPEDKVLEIGCGKGVFIEYLTKNVISCTGLELNEDTVKSATRKGLNILNETLNKHSKNNFAKYDVVCSFQVMEHIASVREFIQDSIDILKCGGKLIVSVPNHDSFLGLDDWNILDMPPHHMGLWNEKSLKSISDIFNIKLKKIYIEPLQIYHFDYYINIMKQKLKDELGICKIISDNIQSLSKNIKGFTILAEYIKE